MGLRCNAAGPTREELFRARGGALQGGPASGSLRAAGERPVSWDTAKHWRERRNGIGRLVADDLLAVALQINGPRVIGRIVKASAPLANLALQEEKRACAPSGGMDGG